MIALALVCLLVIAFMSGAEVVLVSADRVLLRRRLGRSGTDSGEGAGGVQAERAASVLADPRPALSAVLAATAAATVLASALVTVYAGAHGGARVGTEAAAVAALVILVFGEVLPKTVARARADHFFPLVVRALQWTGVALWPVLRVATLASDLLLALFGLRPEGRRGLLTRADLVVLLREGGAGAESSEGASALMSRVFDLGATPLAEILVPRTDFAAVEAGIGADEALTVAAATGHSRLVVYRGSVDAVVGFVHVFDLLRGGGRSAGEIARPAPVLPETVSCLDALRTLARGGDDVAFVADEYGGIAGLVSLGDVLEELLGGLPEEGRGALAPVRALGEHRWLVRGRAALDEVASIPGLTLPPGPYETVAGYLLARTGTIPAAGAAVRLGPWRLVVAEADGRRIVSVLVERVAAEADAG